MMSNVPPWGVEGYFFFLYFEYQNEHGRAVHGFNVTRIFFPNTYILTLKNDEKRARPWGRGYLIPRKSEYQNDHCRSTHGVRV